MDNRKEIEFERTTMIDTKNNPISNFNDFGFSTTTEQEIVQQHASTNTQPLLDSIWALVNPLLINLQTNPTMDVIKWPNRASAIQTLQVKLKNLCNQA
jgi:hypothetical protein